MVKFKSGAKRSSRKPPYCLVPIELLQEVAKTRQEGDIKYEPNNWMLANKEYFVDCLSHAIEHLIEAPWEKDEDIYLHLGHAACNISFILWALRRGKVTAKDFQQMAVIVQNANTKRN
jgi:hypothetical protein